MSIKTIKYEILHDQFPYSGYRTDLTTLVRSHDELVLAIEGVLKDIYLPMNPSITRLRAALEAAK